ncbi:MAG TPA: EamA family transporter [Opitutaceae bacterium]|nr:EamA family transporter [Opitutaceae bacterium]
MTALLVASLIWAFSFGLIKDRLSGLDPTAVAVLRLAVSLAVFAPFFRPRKAGAGAACRLALIGAVQFGAMYVLYLRSYAHLRAYEVALFTITTPILVALIDSALERRWRARYYAAAALSVAGAGVVLWRSLGDSGVLGGFALVQLSNLCFAIGQVAWRRERAGLPSGSGDSSVFLLPLAGALALSLAVSFISTDWRSFAPTPSQWATIAYLGAVASGAGFFLWNLGCTRVNAGVLAACNNVKIPLAIACALVVFGERADIARLLAGAALMALGVWIAGAGPDADRRPPAEAPT